MSQVAPKIDNGAFVQEAIENFLVLLDDIDFTDVFTLMGIGRLQFMLRRQMLVECRGLYIGLWRLALKRSFPNEADAMLAEGYRVPDEYGVARAITNGADRVER